MMMPSRKAPVLTEADERLAKAFLMADASDWSYYRDAPDKVLAAAEEAWTDIAKRLTHVGRMSKLRLVSVGNPGNVVRQLELTPHTGSNPESRHECASRWYHWGAGTVEVLLDTAYFHALRVSKVEPDSDAANYCLGCRDEQEELQLLAPD